MEISQSVSEIKELKTTKYEDISEAARDSSNGGKEKTARETTLQRTQRRRNRKKLVAADSRNQDIANVEQESTENLTEVVLTPALLAQTTVTFKELEVRPICEGKIYVQRDHNFIPVSQDVFFLSSTQNLLDQTNTVLYSAETIAVEYQKRFIPFASFCHGLLAGMAFWHMIMVDGENFHKSEVGINKERIFQITFYIFSTISTVSVLDWCIPNSALTLKDLQKHLANNPVSLFALFACIGAHLTWGLSAKLDDMTAFRLNNGTTLLQLSMENFNELQVDWNSLNLTRCILVIIGFFLTAISRLNK
ncbi:transmembrane protein 237-like [Neocloeon triangulifer]|uniref:transmembrane protein 237-like n=1 Tax=Neocloeon triangulifer TaxID=2078957 RepID=UPI00286FA1BD|nr:transmembrane protein 237-like [Neocloeon triangulifer]